MFEKIIASEPIDKVAARVTSQNGCCDTDSLEHERDALVRAVKRVDEMIVCFHKKHEARRELGLRKHELCQELSSINKALKRKKLLDRDLNAYIIEECKKRLSRMQWQEVLHAASAAKANSLNKEI